ncbi:MAG TPA: radical SAM protein [Candidatus Acidoferrales bacterium]|nr:radical SAM protein [Candidatus Acidoferrales bacterium]
MDLTNRCNMMCRPCFMDANGVGYVDETDMEELKTIFERAGSFKPNREINVLFSGGEATLSPIFLDAIRHAKSKGFHRLHVSTNGIRFAESRNFAVEASAAGLHGVYLQFDGVSEEKNKHRGLGNYMEVKLRALENIAAAGMQTTLQVTVVNGLNNDCVGEIVRFALRNADQIHGVIFQPVMFTGRDERISTEDRYAERYPLSQLAYDLQAQTSIDWRPMRDWYPASAYAIFSHLDDVLDRGAERGSLFPDMHPDHAIMSPLLVDTEKGKAIPIPAFFDLGRFMQDVVQITDSGRSPGVTRAMVLLSLLRNFNQAKAPSGLGPHELRGLFEGSLYRFTRSDGDWSRQASAKTARWRLMFLNGMWFQDAYNYDFATICNSNVPVATWQGEISFCAYNGGGWRKVLESVHHTATVADWYRNHGRHQIYAAGKKVQLVESLSSRPEPLVQIEAAPVGTFFTRG